MNKKEILSEIKKHLKSNLGKDLNEVILFGSVASGKATEDSDYDILIILNKKYDWIYENKIMDLCYDIDLKYDILIDPHILSTEEINSIRGKQPIFVNAINSGIYA